MTPSSCLMSPASSPTRPDTSCPRRRPSYPRSRIRPGHTYSPSRTPAPAPARERHGSGCECGESLSNMPDPAPSSYPDWPSPRPQRPGGARPLGRAPPAVHRRGYPAHTARPGKSARHWTSTPPRFCTSRHTVRSAASTSPRKAAICPSRTETCADRSPAFAPHPASPS